MSLIRTLALAVSGSLMSALAFGQQDFTPPAAVPEPGSIPLVLLGIAGAAVVVRYINRKK